MKKRSLLTIAVILGSLSAFVFIKGGNTSYPLTDKELSKTSVMITRMDGRSGGSGVVLSSSDSGSKVLTNAHVCEVVKNGGVLQTENKKASVLSYQVSEAHDLCLITTKTNLGISTKIANSYSEPFSSAIVVGHPQLLPTIVTRGHFSHYATVQVMTGFRECTDEEAHSDLAIVCALLGGMPVIKNYETQVVSATIQAGSSGSPVFNGEGEIGGLIFAGAGDISYGFIVPQEYLKNFIEFEVSRLPTLKPNNTIELGNMSRSGNKTSIKRLIDQCDANNFEITDRVKEVCKSLTRTVVGW